jgi:hypothetical protein
MSSAPRRDVTFERSLPQVFDDGAFDPYGFRTYVRKAESLGFESAWAGEQILGDVPHYGPIETLTCASTSPSTITPIGLTVGAIGVTPVRTSGMPVSRVRSSKRCSPP